MKYILFVLLVGGIVGCASEKRDDRGERVVEGIQVMVVNGCQYVVYLTSALTSHAGVAMVHAGNCNNPQHIPAPTLQDVLNKSNPTDSIYFITGGGDKIIIHPPIPVTH